MAESEQITGITLGDPGFAEEIEEISSDQDAIVQRITELEKEADNAVVYPIERVRGGVGRWLIPRQGSLKAHYALIKEKERDIDFSPANYPGFDAILTEKYTGAGFFDPMHDRFPKYGPLRDNLATVRNYMLQLYFPDNSPDDQLRIRHLEQIANYLAEGLNNDRVFLGLVPIHNPFKPFIDVTLASAPDGEGARYLYQKILEMQRQSNWTRPFSALTDAFGGTAYGKWDLPALQDSAFARDADQEQDTTQRDIGTRIAGLASAYDTLEYKRMQLSERQRQSEYASDIDAISNQLLFSFYQMRDAVEDLSAPVRREAIDIAHEILRKLSLKLGTTSVTNGLSFQPTDDNAALGSSSGVGRMLVRMAGMMRALGQDMMAHPAVAGAHQAMGQLAYLAKLEALHMANAAGDAKMANSIRGQLSQLRAFGQGLEGKSFGDLLDKMKDGLSAMQQRLRAAGLIVDGHEIDHTAGKGAASQAQAVTNVRQQQIRQQQTVQTKQQQGLNQAQQSQAAQATAQVQAAVQQVQAAQRATAPVGQPPSAFATVPTVKRTSNGAAALKNAKRVQQSVRAEMNRASVTPTPPAPAPKPTVQPMNLDPKLLAGLGSQLRDAQAAAGTLTSGPVGPRTTVDSVRKSTDRSLKLDDKQNSIEHHEHQLQTAPKPGGRSR